MRLLLAALLLVASVLSDTKALLRNVTLSAAQHAAFAAQMHTNLLHKPHAPESLGKRQLLDTLAAAVPMRNISLDRSQHALFATHVQAQRAGQRFEPHGLGRRLLDASIVTSYVMTPLSEAMAGGSPMLKDAERRPLQLAFEITNLSPDDSDTSSRALYTAAQMLPALNSFLRRSLRVRAARYIQHGGIRAGLLQTVLCTEI